VFRGGEGVEFSGYDGCLVGVGPDNLPVSGTYTVELFIDTTATGGGQLKVSR
jgi:hypothetical protein